MVGRKPVWVYVIRWVLFLYFLLCVVGFCWLVGKGVLWLIRVTLS